MEIFDWDDYARIESSMSRVEIMVMRRSFQQFLDGNSGYSEYTGGEIGRVYEGFKVGWIAHEAITEKVTSRG